MSASEATLAEVRRLVIEGRLTPKQISFRMGVAVGLVKRIEREIAKQTKGAK